MNTNYPYLNNFNPVFYQVGTEEFELVVDPKQVFPPSETTLTLAEVIKNIKVDSFLDIGTGSGLLAIVAAKSNCKNIWAIDKNCKAANCASKNAKRTNVEGKINFEVQDVLSWEPNLKFDLIITNPPFMPMPKGAKFISDEIKLAINGGINGTKMIIAFAEKALSLLNTNGKLIIPVPHFTCYKRVFDRLSLIYSTRVLSQKLIRYWLSEYNESFKKHIKDLFSLECVDIVENCEHIKAYLSIVECSPR